MNATQIRVKLCNDGYIYHLPFTEVEDGDLYVFGEEFGPKIVIKTSSIEDAYEEYITEVLPVCDRPWEAYGIYDERVYDRYCDLISDSPYHANEFLKRYKALYDKKDRVVQIDDHICMNEWLPLIEGFAYDANGEIKDVSEYLWVKRYDKTLKKWVNV